MNKEPKELLIEVIRNAMVAELREAEERYREVLLPILDAVADCPPNTMIGAALPKVLIDNANAVLTQRKEGDNMSDKTGTPITPNNLLAKGFKKERAPSKATWDIYTRTIGGFDVWFACNYSDSDGEFMYLQDAEIHWKTMEEIEAFESLVLPVEIQRKEGGEK